MANSLVPLSEFEAKRVQKLTDKIMEFLCDTEHDIEIASRAALSVAAIACHTSEFRLSDVLIHISALYDHINETNEKDEACNG